MPTIPKKVSGSPVVAQIVAEGKQGPLQFERNFFFRQRWNLVPSVSSVGEWAE